MSASPTEKLRRTLYELSLEGESVSGAAPRRHVWVVHSDAKIRRYNAELYQRDPSGESDEWFVSPGQLQPNDIVAYAIGSDLPRWLFVKNLAHHRNGEWATLFTVK